MTCELGASGLIEVTHDATSGHSQHQCYINDDDNCICECSDHAPEDEVSLKCTPGRVLSTWNTAAEWQTGNHNGDTWNGYCTTVAWASNYNFWYCGGKARGNGKCQLAHRDNNGSGPAHFPHWGGNFCEWTSTVQKVTSEEAGMKSGIRGLNVNLRWKEYGNKGWADHVEVEIKSCQNEDMDHHCTDWTRAHYHRDDSPYGWSWWNDSDDNHLDIANKDMFYQVRIHMDSSWGWNGYALDKLEVKAEDCEPKDDYEEEQAPPSVQWILDPRIVPWMCEGGHQYVNWNSAKQNLFKASQPWNADIQCTNSVSCTDVCAGYGKTCDQSSLDALAKDDALFAKAFFGAKNLPTGHTCRRWHTGCEGGNNCVKWGSPFIHSSHIGDSLCWSGTTAGQVAPCGQRPVDGHHRRLCPCL
jgi:hypothetical protein